MSAQNEFSDVLRDNKKHRKRTAGRKAEKKKAKDGKDKKTVGKDLPPEQRNPKAFTFNSAVNAERQFRRKQDISAKRTRMPEVDRTPLEPPPTVVALVGPPKVGKSLLLRCLIKRYTKQNISVINGPVTVVTGKKHRITFIECKNDINAMVDVAKVADVVLLLVDAYYGFEMEVFEFLNICQVHGEPRIMGVLTHLDQFTKQHVLQQRRRELKHRFWTEIYQGAKLFYLSGVKHGEYLYNDVHNLSRFISVMKLPQLQWRKTHSYVLADRLEDLTSPEAIRQDLKCNRNVSLYGYVRGSALQNDANVHIPGCGDYHVAEVSYLPDPCPLAQTLKKRSLLEKEKLIYAPFSGIGGIVYDKDAVYIELGGSHSHQESETKFAPTLASHMIDTQVTVDEKIAQSQLQLFTNSVPLTAEDMEDSDDDEHMNLNTPEEKMVPDTDGRLRRKAIFNDERTSTVGSGEQATRGKKRKMVATGLSPKRTKKVENEQEHLVYDSDSSGNSDSVVSADEESDSGCVQSQNGNECKITYNSGSDSDISDEEEQINNKDEEFNSESIQETGKQLENSETVDNDSEREIDDEDEDENDSDSEAETDDDANTDSDNDVLNAEETSVKWKENLAQNAAIAFYKHHSSTRNIVKMVYGKDPKPVEPAEPQPVLAQDDDLFQLIRDEQDRKKTEKSVFQETDCSKFTDCHVQNWDNEKIQTTIRDCFVTGQYGADDAATLLKDDDDMDGDFEDLETGEKHTAASASPNIEAVKSSSEELTKEERVAKKEKLKKMFNALYDETEKTPFHEDLKRQVDEQTKLNQSEFDGLEDHIRVQYEGFRPGMYVRMEIRNVPCELITNFDPTYPLIAGGLQPNEENVSFIRVNLKKHRWYKRLLKTKDPLIISLGWRRFQTIPLYAIEDHNGRHRYLKYTPQHMPCVAHFWGPNVQGKTGFAAFQSVSHADAHPGFRIAATGSVVCVDKAPKIVKKLKLRGYPHEVFQKTAFIKDMFSSSLEVAKFEGAKIRTVSGIRGQIKRATTNSRKYQDGSFRATFEDKILMSDIVFLRTWREEPVPNFYNPVMSLLLPPGQKNRWEGMKTVAQLKKEKNIKNLPNPDSLYTPIARKTKFFKPLTVPKALQQALPFKDKPKKSAENKSGPKRVAVILEPQEKAKQDMMAMLRTNYKAKQHKRKEAAEQKSQAYKKQQARNEQKYAKRNKELKKRVYRFLQREGLKPKAPTKRR